MRPHLKIENIGLDTSSFNNHEKLDKKNVLFTSFDFHAVVVIIYVSIDNHFSIYLVVYVVFSELI